MGKKARKQIPVPYEIDESALAPASSTTSSSRSEETKKAPPRQMKQAAPKVETFSKKKKQKQAEKIEPLSGSESEIDSDDLMSPSEDENGESSEGDDQSEGSDRSEVVGEFEHFDPAEGDFHAIKNLLKDLLDGKEYDASGLTETLIEQGPSVGTVQKISGEEHVIGLISVINLQKYRERQFVKDITKFIRDKCPADKKHQVAELFDPEKKTGLILSERLFNVPDSMALPLYVALFDEVSWAVEDQPTAEERDAYKFDNYLLLTKVVKAIPSALGQPTPFNVSGSKKEEKKRKRDHTSSDDTEETIVFLKSEEEAFVKEAHMHYDFPSVSTSEFGLTQCNFVAVVSADRQPALLEAVKNIVGSAAMDKALE